MEPLKFTDLPLSPELQKGVRKMGFRKLTPIQAEAIPLLLKGRDVIGQAQTGTGKTAAFGLPMLMRTNKDEPFTQGLVITPTRELAEQITEHMRRYTRYTDIRIVVIHGGRSIKDQVNILYKPAHIIIGTPGRLLDLVKKRVLDLSSIKAVVIDEADKMLEMGFIGSIDSIISRTPYVRQTSLWSATLDEEVLSLTTRYMRHPRKVIISRDEVAQENVEQYIIPVRDDKLSTLYKLLNKIEVMRGIIFLNTREATDRLTGILKKEGYLIQGIHGGYTQVQRDQVLEDFKLNKFNWLVSTDLASRGLDIQGIECIINYEVPEDPEIYFHRIGRTARKGETGISYTLMNPYEEILWNRIMNITNITPKTIDLGV
jgi:ATP-dependent RNA helicase DeaD